MAFAKVMIIGNLGRDPEMRYTPNGRPVTEFSVAVSHSKPRPADRRVGRRATDWYRVTVWGDRAERTAEQFRKGNKVFVEGRFRTREYEAKDGQKRISLEITADNVISLDARVRDEEAARSPLRRAASAAGAGGRRRRRGPCEPTRPAAPPRTTTSTTSPSDDPPAAERPPRRVRPATTQETPPMPPRTKKRDDYYRDRRRRKVCSFCADKTVAIDYKEVNRLRRYLSERAKIEPRRKTGHVRRAPARALGRAQARPPRGAAPVRAAAPPPLTR